MGQWFPLSLIQAATSRVTRLINSADSTDYIEGTVNGRFSMVMNGAESLRLETGVIDDRSASGVSLRVSGSNRFFIGSPLLAYVSLNPSTDGVDSSLGGRAARWVEYRQSRTQFIEDFLGGAAITDFLQWLFDGSTGPTLVTGGARGLVSLSTGAVLNNTSRLSMKVANFPRSVAPSMEWVIRPDAAADIIETICRVGLTDDIAFGGATNALVAEFDTSIDATTWQLIGYSAGVRTVGTPGTDIVPVAGTFQRVEVALGTDGSATLYVNGASRATVGAGAVGTASLRPGAFVQELDATAPAGKTWTADRVEMRATAVV